MKEHKRIDICSGINPLGPSNKVKAAIRKGIKHISGSPEGSAEKLKKLLLSYYGIPGECLVFSGALRDLLCQVPKTFGLRKGLAPGPVPHWYGAALEMSGASLSVIPADGKDGCPVPAEVVYDHLDGHDFLMIADPNRITGRMQDDIEETITRAAERGLAVVVDESLIEFTGQTGFSAERLRSDRTVTLRTTANYYGVPGLELAYAVSSVPTAAKLRASGCFPVNVLAVEAARAALKDRTFRGMTEKYLYNEKKAIMKTLRKINQIQVFESDANVLLLRLHVPPERVFGALARAGFSVEGCTAVAGLAGPYLGFSVQKHEYNLKFVKVLRRCLEG